MKITSKNILHIPFHKSLFITISGLFIIFVVAAVALQYHQERSFRRENLNNLLQTYNAHINQILPDSGVIEKINWNVLYKATQKADLRLTIIDATTGQVLLDNGTDHNIEGSHLNRPEIQAALAEKKDAYSIRYSETLGKPYFYAAHRYGNRIIRSAIPFEEAEHNFLHVDPMFRYILLSIALLFILALFLFSHSLGKAISNLDTFATQAQQGIPLDNTSEMTDNTIGRITQNLRQIYENLRQTREKLALEEEKLLTHIQLSREGIAIFTADKQMIVSNNLFIQYLNHITDQTLDSISQLFEEKELTEITQFLTTTHYRYEITDKAIIKQIRIQKNGRSFEVKGILFHDGSFEVVIFDNTEREREDLLKKQLTQNVAHELKTPVSSIKGYLETILSTSHLDETKRNLFMERCFAQTQRLSDLLRDISMLNRLDESNELFDRQSIDLHAIIQEVVNESMTSLESKSMHVTLQGFATPMYIEGNHSLLYSIFRNLTDNAIAYAGNGTQININCYLADEKYYYISFVDNGTGVEEAHLQRLFERFYRVDKGRSRKLGGTGLGLAIVKNAVLFHGGEIMAKNAATGGLEIIFTLRKK